MILFNLVSYIIFIVTGINTTTIDATTAAIQNYFSCMAVEMETRVESSI